MSAPAWAAVGLIGALVIAWLLVMALWFDSARRARRAR